MTKNINRKALVVGSWAKEQITIENIKKDENTRVFSYLDTKNPAIISISDGHEIGDLYDVEGIVNYAKRESCDFVLVTTAAPLSAGLADRLIEEDISIFGPTKSAARLEYDKVFARNLLKRHCPFAIPEFGVFDDYEKAVDFAKKHDYQVAVKPQGLTDGLGVKVFLDQLKNKEDVKEYIKRIIENRISGSKRVLMEEKLVGEEFTIQCFVKDEKVIPTPAVQDFKKLLCGEKGPNTASMGSYSSPGNLLPFMKQEDYETGLNIIRRTLRGFKEETKGDVCCGFLYGQFMITQRGIKLIEYNFRPGDPEWMNIACILKTNILDIVEAMLSGKKNFEVDFEKKATVCKYITPPEYPEKLNQTLEIELDEKDIRKNGVGIYYSCGEDGKGSLNVGSERGIAFLAKEESIIKAGNAVESAISAVKGNFHHRKDIGTESLIEEKIKIVDALRGGFGD